MDTFFKSNNTDAPYLHARMHSCASPTSLMFEIDDICHQDNVYTDIVTHSASVTVIIRVKRFVLATSAAITNAKEKR